MGFLLKFSLKSHLLFFFLTKNSKIKTLYLAYKTLHFLKIVAMLYRVFAQFLSKISPFGLFFDKKQQNKDDVPCIKNVTFFENCCCIIGGFWSILSLKSHLSFSGQKTQVNRLVFHWGWRSIWRRKPCTLSLFCCFYIPMHNWRPDFQLESTTFLPGIQVESATFF